MSKAATQLAKTYEKNSYESFNFKVNNFTDSELEILEVLTARFSRLSDIISQKVLRNISEIELEAYGSQIDLLNRAEKKLLIKSKDIFEDIRFIRNKVVHEYEDDQSSLYELFEKVIKYTPELIEASKNIERYTKQYCDET